jgi:putative membrane protein
MTVVLSFLFRPLNSTPVCQGFVVSVPMSATLEAAIASSNEEGKEAMERSNRNLLIGLGVFAVLLLAVLPAIGGGMMAPGFGAYGGPFGARPFINPFVWGFWGVGMLVRLLFFGLIVYLLLRLFRGRGYRGYRGYYDEPHTADLTPAEILSRRYAAGEISREQYEEMRRTLEPTSA